MNSFKSAYELSQVSINGERFGDTNNYDLSPSNHNHDGVYSPVSHNHDGVYAPVSHNHDGTYSPVGHYHDDRYFTESEADSRYVNNTGDTMIGNLNFAPNYGVQYGSYANSTNFIGANGRNIINVGSSGRLQIGSGQWPAIDLDTYVYAEGGLYTPNINMGSSGFDIQFGGNPISCLQGTSLAFWPAQVTVNGCAETDMDLGTATFRWYSLHTKVVQTYPVQDQLNDIAPVTGLAYAFETGLDVVETMAAMCRKISDLEARLAALEGT